jgi:predicted MFS family arabinose efflux permease
MFWLFMAAGGISGGRIGQRLGATLSIRIGVTGSMLAIGALALAPNWTSLLVLMPLAGLANALTQPAVDLALFEVVPRERLSLAFGIKQTAFPGAALVAGLSIPVLASTIGWRWAFVACAMIGIPALAGIPRLSPGHKRNSAARVAAEQKLAGVYVFATVFMLAMIAVSATGAFYVESAIAGGSSPNSAGVYLAVGSACGILGRFVFAWQLGRVSRPLVATALIMIVGGGGAVSFALVPPGWGLFLGTLIAIGAGWGWNGLLTLAVVSTYPQAPARASGYIVLGAGAGGVMGPFLFGFAVQKVGFSPAWIAVGLCFFVAAALLFVVVRRGKYVRTFTG